MRKMKKSIIVSALFASVLVGGVAVQTGASTQAGAGNIEWSTLETPIENEYDFGETFVVPTRTLSVNGAELDVKSVVVYPDGNATQATVVKLTMGGSYTVRYTAYANGNAYVDEYTFWVTGAQVSVQSAKSSFSYGAYSYDVDRTALVDTKTGETEHKQYSYTCESGLMVRLARGDVLEFHTPIDIKNVTSADSLVKAFATPDEQGSPDFEKLTFTFTDVYNPNITLKFVSRHTEEGYDFRKTYSLVAGNGQKESGLDLQDASNVYVGRWGTSGDGTYTRRFKAVYWYEKDAKWVDDYREQDEMPIDFRYDWENKTAHIRDYRTATRVNTIGDLDNPEHFDTLWSGFTSGKVRLSVSADVYTGETANFCITHVRGLDLTQTDYVDTQAPVITVENDYEEMPNGLVGGEYPVPKATAFDWNVGNCLVKTSVWYNYTSQNPKSVSIENGWFKTEKHGDYAIVFEAVDGNGNKATEVRWVRVEKELPALTVTLQGDKMQSGECGDWIDVADYAVLNALGNEQDVSVSVTARFEGGEIAVEGGFRPEKAGEYQIVYTATDYIGRVAQTDYYVTVETGEKAKFIEEAYLPPAFVSGMQYVMPTVYASDYTSGTLVQKLAYAEIKDKNGVRHVECGETFTPVVAKQGDVVTVVYKYGDVQSKTYEIPATVATGRNEQGRTRLFTANYLHGAGFTANSTTEHTEITATQESGCWTFANRLLAQNFSLKIRGVKNASEYDGIWITLSDSADKNQQVKIYVQNLSSGMMFYVGKQTLKTLNVLNEQGGFTLGYANGNVSVGMTKLLVETYENGKPFIGFSSGKITLRVAFDNASVGAKYALEEICGQPMTLQARDGFSPNIVVFGDYGGLQTYGSIVTLPSANALDVLDPFVTFTLTVKNPNGSVATDVNGKKLENVDPTAVYTLKMANYGQYFVSYKAVDSVGNVNDWSYPLIVKDDVLPTLTFSGSFKDTAQVGDTLVLPNFTVSDNVTSANDLIVKKYVYTPSGTVYELSKSSNSIVCLQTGEYEFRITVMDEEGNLALYTRKVTVSEKTEVAE